MPISGVIVCRECGETWPAERVRRAASRQSPPQAETEQRRHRGGAAAARHLLHTNDNAWQAKIEGDHWPEPPRQRRLPMTAAAVASVFFLAAFFGAREAAVAALPDLAGLYAAIGLPVNLERLAIKGVKAERTHDFAGGRVSVRATIRNLGRRRASDSAARRGAATERSGSLGESCSNPPAKTLGAGQSTPIVVDLDAVPDRGRRRWSCASCGTGETLPSGGKLQLDVGMSGASAEGVTPLYSRGGDRRARHGAGARRSRRANRSGSSSSSS